MNGINALRSALETALSNPRVRLLGEAVELSPATRGLRARFPDQVHLLPAADATLTGIAVGMAIAGDRPVVELAGPEALHGALQQLEQEAAAIGGEFEAPVVLRVPVVPGQADPSGLLRAPIQVAAVGQPGEARILLEAALQSGRPTVILEPVEILSEGSETLDPLPLGRARLLRQGEHATVLAWGSAVPAALEAAAGLAQEGIEIDIIDLRSTLPLDEALVGERVRHTGRAILAGLHPGSPVLEAVLRLAFLRLEAPPGTAAGTVSEIADRVREAVHY